MLFYCLGSDGALKVGDLPMISGEQNWPVHPSSRHAKDLSPTLLDMAGGGGRSASGLCFLLPSAQQPQPLLVQRERQGFP